MHLFPSMSSNGQAVKCQRCGVQGGTAAAFRACSPSHSGSKFPLRMPCSVRVAGTTLSTSVYANYYCSMDAVLAAVSVAGASGFA